MACSAAVCTWRFRQNGSHFETTKGQSSLQTTTNHQQPFFREPKIRARRFWPPEVRIPELRSTKRQWQVLTKTPKLHCQVHHSSHNMNFENVKVVAFEANYHERLFLKPGTLLWTQTLGTIITYFQKPRRASREHELNGHKRKLTLNSV